MFCRQCEQTAKGSGCTVQGVCGKTDEVAVLQDVLIHILKGIGYLGLKARGLGIVDEDADRFIEEGLFTTVTNVNFDADRMVAIIRKGYAVKERLKEKYVNAVSDTKEKGLGVLPAYVTYTPAPSKELLLKEGKTLGVLAEPDLNGDIRSLREILLYGMKGMAAYADHARLLGRTSKEVSAFFYKGLDALSNDALDAAALTDLVMEFGRVNLDCLAMLDSAHTTHFGSPEPTKVSLGVKKGPAIIVSGHDLFDLEQLLEQTEGRGINIYTHGEMLPSHGYPELRKHTHLAGHFGTAWQNQQTEFDGIPAAVLMTTNCIQKPKDSYSDRIFTTGLVAWPGVTHIVSGNGKKDFTPVIEKALALGGFPEEAVEKEITVGFAHAAVLGVADNVVTAVKQKKIRHFFLIGGCDGAKPGRNYYTEFAAHVPDDCMIITLACGKFRFNRMEFGTVAGLPRLLDCGQCNDAYSAIKIATALAEAFGVTVNDLPLSFILSWYEQKAVCILLTLLSLGVKNIRIGPSLPAFISPGVLKVLVDTFGIQPVTDAREDLKKILST